jgi:hypothetical protein
MITAIAAWALILLVCLAWRVLATSDVRARLWQLVCGTKRQRGKLRVLDAEVPDGSRSKIQEAMSSVVKDSDDYGGIGLAVSKKGS